MATRTVGETLDFREPSGCCQIKDKIMRILNRDGIHGRSPLKGILSEHSEQALMFIKILFKQLR